MGLFEGKTPAERNKTIAALALGAVALFFLARMFFFAGSSQPSNNRPRRNTNTNASRSNAGAANGVAASDDLNAEGSFVPAPVVFRPSTPDVPDAARNIFAFYVPPPPKPKSTNAVATPQPTPVPTPPLALVSITPANVYARTGEFTLQVNGDRFTPQSRVYFNGQELPTRFLGAQQLTATVPAQLISAPGAGQVIARTPDNALFSNAATLSITPPPTPDFTFVGVLIRPRGNDTALLKDRKGEVVSVQRGDLVGGRFRVNSISDRAVEFVDQQLKIKHTLAYSDPRTSGPGTPPRPGAPQPRPARADDEDNEP